MSVRTHFVGTLVEDVELRFTARGVAVAKFRVAVNKRVKNEQTGTWEDRDATFLTCNVWRQTAENAAETLTKGSRVVVVGELRQRTWETKEGAKRTVYEVEVDDLGPSLLFTGYQALKAQRGTPEQADDPWSQPAPTDEPPF